MMKFRAAALAVSLALSPCVAVAGGGGGGGGHGDATKTASRLSSAESFVPLPSINTASSAGRGISGMISVDFSLDVPDPRLRARVVAMRPRVVDALRMSLSEYATTRIRAGAAPDPDQIVLMAQAAATRAVGGPGVRVLISNVMLNERR